MAFKEGKNAGRRRNDEGWVVNTSGNEENKMVDFRGKILEEQKKEDLKV